MSERFREPGEKEFDANLPTSTPSYSSLPPSSITSHGHTSHSLYNYISSSPSEIVFRRNNDRPLRVDEELINKSSSPSQSVHRTNRERPLRGDEDTEDETQCPNTDGVYGEPSNVDIVVTFDYEVEMTSDGINVLETEIIPAIENAFVADVVAELVVGCPVGHSSHRKQRKRKERQLRLAPRSLDVVGIELISSVLHPEKECRAPLINNDSVCSSLSGSLRLYANDDTTYDLEDMEERALVLISAQMNTGTYDSEINIKYLIGVSYFPPAIGSYSISSTDKQPMSMGSIVLVVVLSCVASIVLMLLLVPKCNRKKKGEEVIDTSGDIEIITDHKKSVMSSIKEEVVITNNKEQTNDIISDDDDDKPKKNVLSPECNTKKESNEVIDESDDNEMITDDKKSMISSIKEEVVISDNDEEKTPTSDNSTSTNDIKTNDEDKPKEDNHNVDTTATDESDILPTKPAVDVFIENELL